MEYKLTCGIETHVELATRTKIFCGCTTAFGGKPNTHCCPVCTGQPGTLPVLNKRVVEFAVRAGLAVNCKINSHCHMDRKNYFYPDLPKAYQISQADEPVCGHGYIRLDSGKKIGITRIHIEEDAGKLVHEEGSTYIDYNRSGVPLIEIVSEPDIASPEEAKEYAEKLQLIMRYIQVSDCKMQEGSMRCDVNVSLTRNGEPLGTRTEIKNINSVSNLGKAMKAEIKRQRNILEGGGRVVQSTLRYDAASDSVSVMRVKENSDDYRYFPEPDILRFHIPEEMVEQIGKEIPELPDAKYKRYVDELKLSRENAGQLFRYRKVSEFFEKTVSEGASARNTANLIIKSIYAALNTEEEKELFEIRLQPAETAKLVKLIDGGKLNFNHAAAVLAEMLESGKPVSEYVREEDIREISADELRKICTEAAGANPKAAEDVRNGKDKAMNVLYGYVMKETKGKADIGQARKLLYEILQCSENKK